MDDLLERLKVYADRLLYLLRQSLEALLAQNFPLLPERAFIWGSADSVLCALCRIVGMIRAQIRIISVVCCADAADRT